MQFKSFDTLVKECAQHRTPFGSFVLTDEEITAKLNKKLCTMKAVGWFKGEVCFDGKVYEGMLKSLGKGMR